MSRGCLEDIRPQNLSRTLDRRENGFTCQTRMLYNDCLDRLTGGEPFKDVYDGDAGSGNDRLPVMTSKQDSIRFTLARVSDREVWDSRLDQRVESSTRRSATWAVPQTKISRTTCPPSGPVSRCARPSYR